MKQYELPVTPPVFRLKGGSLAATVLELASVAPAALALQLAQKVAQAPQLLRHSPLIIDLDKLGEADGPLDLAGLLATCRQHELQPVALRAHRSDDLRQAQRIGFAVLPPARGRERSLDGGDTREAVAVAGVAGTVTAEGPAGASAPTPEATPASAPAPAPAPAPASASIATRVVNQPVRGGQQVYAEGDLILLAPVSAGAEVMAGGNIHCYAPLRGRALAGVQGDANARLFCRELSAELVAIAGHYRTADDLKADALWGKAAQLFLRDGQLTLVAL